PGAQAIGGRHATARAALDPRAAGDEGLQAARQALGAQSGYGMHGRKSAGGAKGVRSLPDGHARAPPASRQRLRAGCERPPVARVEYCVTRRCVPMPVLLLCLLSLIGLPALAASASEEQLIRDLR